MTQSDFKRRLMATGRALNLDTKGRERPPGSPDSDRSPGDATLGVGSTIWYRDINRRRYERNNSLSGPPIERGHWVECLIVGETSRSWITDHWKAKVPKKLPFPNGWASDEADMLRRVWMASNSHALGAAVSNLTWGVDGQAPERFEKMKAIATLVDFKPEAP